MAAIDIPATIKETDELLTQKEDVLALIAENRMLLRNAVKAKKTNAEQTKWIEETFPQQETKTPEQRVQARREALEDAEKKAAEAAAKSNSKGTRARAAA